MPATVAGIHLGPDTHANRPAANASGLPIGSLYVCSTHELIYQTDGSAWTTWATLSSGLTNPMTTAGDIIVGGASGAPARLGIGSALQHLRVNSGATALEYADPPTGGGGVTIDELGTTTVGGNWEAFTTSRIYMKKVTVSNAGRVLSLAAYLKGDGSGVRSYRVGLWTDATGSPGTIIGWTDGNGLHLYMDTTGRWIEMPLAATVAAADYWIGLQAISDTNFSIDYATSGSDLNGPATSDWILDGSLMTETSTTRNYALHIAVLRT